MSVILSACRHTKQRAVARALKKKAEKHKMGLRPLEGFEITWKKKMILTKDDSRTKSEMKSIFYRKLKKEAELQELEASALEAFTRMWSFKIDDEYYYIMLYLANDKDTVDIFCNEDEVTNVMVNVSPEGATFDFVIGASYKARIACTGDPNTGLVHTLSIDGKVVPEAE